MNYGLLGTKLGHSYSPAIHQMLGSFPYFLYEKEPDQLDDFLRNTPFSGLNVTMPYKKKVIPYCHKLSDAAQKIGAVNTILRSENGLLEGYNTDYYGFQYMLQQSRLETSGKKFLILGSGGASATAQAVLADSGAIPIVISRTGPNNYTNLAMHKDANAVINATPVGMFPENGNKALDLSQFPELHGVLDMIYNPSRTALFMQAENLGLKTLNGLWMLVAQAKKSAELFLNHPIKDEMIPEIFQKIRLSTENIILVGMPGCGKTTTGRILSQLTGMEFIDTDDEIEKRIGLSIPEIFTEYGEKFFRNIESQILADCGKKSGIILATGGGAVLKPENYLSLHQNGTIFWIQRDIDKLVKTGRPLSQISDLNVMYKIRASLYGEYADRIVFNNKSSEDTAHQILRERNSV